MSVTLDFVLALAWLCKSRCTHFSAYMYTHTRLHMPMHTHKHTHTLECCLFFYINSLLSLLFRMLLFAFWIAYWCVTIVLTFMHMQPPVLTLQNLGLCAQGGEQQCASALIIYISIWCHSSLPTDVIAARWLSAGTLSAVTSGQLRFACNVCDWHILNVLLQAVAWHAHLDPEMNS